jgi:hypothetical protein
MARRRLPSLRADRCVTSGQQQLTMNRRTRARRRLISIQHQDTFDGLRLGSLAFLNTPPARNPGQKGDPAARARGQFNMQALWSRCGGRRSVERGLRSSTPSDSACCAAQPRWLDGLTIGTM